ncbi:cytochrome d ubiquinol oxidase subunit II [Caenibacillus caldisaponilyticus]|uniref:cytochrome d ubiquinol oxidase subunit II n=1 Tax=Caenibacillus caldisaponilyticus TaxID=1674942 RepID=UPI001178AD63|nr:cytochrome d ubiquinol oxidase subunit II [Caenibacillus caldisaponilyticus]
MHIADATLAVIILWTFIFVYAVAASIDFGAGFWSMLYMNRGKLGASEMANRYLSPSWEVTNVFIVLIVVSLYSFFPGANDILGSTLLLPGSVILLLLAFRSAFLVFSHSAVEKYRRVLTVISGMSGVMIPALLILVLPVTHGTFIHAVNGVKLLDFSTLFMSLSFYAFTGFAITNTLYLSSLLLADYARVAGDQEAYRVYRKSAIGLGPFTLLMAVMIVVALQNDADWLFLRLQGNFFWLLLAVFAFLLGYLALFYSKKGKAKPGVPRASVVLTIVQYLLAGYAYGKAHYPYIVYPYVTVAQGFTDPNTFRALSISYLIGLMLLLPGFIFFWKMFMADHRYIRADKDSVDDRGNK